MPPKISADLDGFSLKALGRAIAQAFKPSWSYSPRRTSNNYYEAFHTSPRFDALEMLASDVASATFKLYDKRAHKADPKNAEAIDEHPLLDFLANPMPDHPELDGYAMVHATIIYRRMTGEAFWVIERDRRGLPAMAYLVPPTWVIQTPTSSVPEYLIQPMGNTSHRPISVPPEDVIWFKDVNLSSPYGRGRGRDEKIGDEIESDEYASKYAKNFFYNDATPPIAIEAPNATQEQADRLKENWVQRLGGFLNARKPAVLPWSGAKIHKINDSAREMDFVESRKFLRDTCNQHFALPPEKQGILENSNRSTIDSAEYIWTKGTVSHEVARFFAALNRQLVPQFDPELVLVPDNVIPEDGETKWKQMREAVESGLATRNEARQALGLEPDKKRGDVYLLKVGVVERPVNEEPEEPEDDPEPPDEPPSPPEPEDDDEEEPETAKGFHTKAMDEDRAKAYWDSFDTKAASVEEPFKSTVKAFAEDKAIEARKVFKQKVRDGLPFSQALEAMLEEVYGPDADEALRDGLAPDWILAMRKGAELAEELLGRPINFDLLNPAFLTWVKDNGLDLAKLVNDTTRDAMRKTIADGVAAGEGINKLARRIAEVQEDLAGYRAERLARTESARSVNQGTWATYKAEGVKRIEWIATRDGRAREAHAAVNGAQAGIDEGFMVGGERLLFPLDPNASAENTVNCRCGLAAVID